MIYNFFEWILCEFSWCKKLNKQWSNLFFFQCYRYYSTKCTSCASVHYNYRASEWDVQMLVGSGTWQGFGSESILLHGSASRTVLAVAKHRVVFMCICHLCPLWLNINISKYLKQQNTHCMQVILLGTSLNYPGFNTESFLTSLTFFWLLLLLFFFSSLLSFLFIVRSSLYSFPPGHELNRSRNEHRIISESAYLQEIFCVPFVS